MPITKPDAITGSMNHPVEAEQRMEGGGSWYFSLQRHQEKYSISKVMMEGKDGGDRGEGSGHRSLSQLTRPCGPAVSLSLPASPSEPPPPHPTPNVSRPHSFLPLWGQKERDQSENCPWQFISPPLRGDGGGGRGHSDRGS